MFCCRISNQVVPCCGFGMPIIEQMCVWQEMLRIYQQIRSTRNYCFQHGYNAPNALWRVQKSPLILLNGTTSRFLAFCRYFNRVVLVHLPIFCLAVVRPDDDDYCYFTVMSEACISFHGMLRYNAVINMFSRNFMVRWKISVQKNLFSRNQMNINPQSQRTVLVWNHACVT